MQKSDREFIEKYNQKQFEMCHPVPQIVTKEAAAPVAVQEAAQEAAQEAVQVAVQVAVQEAAQEAAQKVTKEAAVQEAAPVAAQNDVQVVIQMVSSLKRQEDLADDENQPNPLELIKSALQQINYALHLLSGVKKTSSPEISEKVASEPIVSEAILPEAQIVSEVILPIQNLDYISDVDVDVEVQKEKEEEFKIVMPKKLKNKKTVTTLLPVQEKIKTKKDEFPSLGSSFAPVKTGFWSGTVKKSLEIAKSIAHIPSPPPLKKSIGMVRHEPSKDDLSEEEYSDTTEEYHIQKRYVEEDDNWQ